MATLKRLHGEEGSDDEIDELTAFMPSGFGQQPEKRDLASIFESHRRLPPKPPKPADSDADSDDDDDSDDEDDFPVSHVVSFKPHTKAISSISLDPSGTRFTTSSHDTLLKIYDFPSMSPDHRHAFHSSTPSENHHLHASLFSPSGSSLLVLPASNQAKIYDRDGYELVEFVKGDPYLRDMHNTKGHVAEITAGAWSPIDEGVVVTASADSSVRIWDVENKRSHKEIMVFKSREKGGRSRMCSLAWTEHGGKGGWIGSTALDGSLVVYAGGGPYSRPVMEVRDAHKGGEWTGGLAWSRDARLCVTRGNDGFVKCEFPVEETRFDC